MAQLKEKLPDYPNPKRQHRVEFEVKGQLGSKELSSHQHQAWYGFRLESEDKLHIAQFTRSGFVFSRLKPYEDWERFETEALRLWDIYSELTEPSEIQRLGVRFINLITPIKLEQLSSMLTVSPRSPQKMQLPLKKFMHQNTFNIPGYQYNLNVIQTIQAPSSPQDDAFGLILDLDVFTTQDYVDFKDRELKSRLGEMRWIKNKAFFSFLTEDTIAQFI